MLFSQDNSNLTTPIRYAFGASLITYSVTTLETSYFNSDFASNKEGSLKPFHYWGYNFEIWFPSQNFKKINYVIGAQYINGSKGSYSNEDLPNNSYKTSIGKTYLWLAGPYIGLNALFGFKYIGFVSNLSLGYFIVNNNLSYHEQLPPDYENSNYQKFNEGYSGIGTKFLFGLYFNINNVLIMPSWQAVGVGNRNKGFVSQGWNMRLCWEL